MTMLPRAGLLGTMELIRSLSMLLLFVISLSSASRVPSNPYRGTKFANTTVYGAMIMTDPQIAEVLGRDFHKVPQGVNGSAAQNAEWRIQNGKNTANELPFHVDFWCEDLLPCLQSLILTLIYGVCKGIRYMRLVVPIAEIRAMIEE